LRFRGEEKETGLGGLFFGFLSSGFFIGLLFVERFLRQGFAELKFTVFYFHGKQGFAFPASEGTLENVFGDKKSTVRITGRALDIYLHQVIAPS
jgi:hypothetical protein